MGDLSQSAHDLLMEQEEEEKKRQMTKIKRMISTKLRDMDLDELALTHKLIIHKKQIARFFELQKMLGRQIG